MSLIEARRRSALRINDPLPVKPFLEWFDARIAAYAGNAVEGDEYPQLRALADIGWADEAGVRRLNRWRSWTRLEHGRRWRASDVVERAHVENALHEADAFMWELVEGRESDGICRQDGGEPVDCDLRRQLLAVTRRAYADPEPHLEQGQAVHCPTCREPTKPLAVGTTLICPWCETTLGEGVTRSLGGDAAGASTMGRVVLDVGETFCPRCSDEVSPVEGVLADGVIAPVCPWCDTELVKPSVRMPERARRSRKRPPHLRGPRRRRPAKISHLTPAPPPDPVALLQGDVVERSIADRARGWPESAVREALALFVETPNVRDVAERMVARYPGRWANAQSCRSSIDQVFRDCGVMTRDDRRTRAAREAHQEADRQRAIAYLATPDPGYAYRGDIDPRAVWEAAFRYYVDGHGFKRIAQYLLDRGWAPWSTAGSGSSRLHHIFRTNGWPTRSQREATAAANYRHGLSIHRDKPEYNRYHKRQQNGTRPRCAHVGDTGRRCFNFAMKGDRHCWAHSDKVDRRAVAARSRAKVAEHLLPSGPFVQWLAGRVEAYGSQRRAAAVLEVNPTILGRVLKNGGTSHRGMLTRRWMEQRLAACMANDPDALVPRLADLYDVERETEVSAPPREAVAA